MATTLSGGKEFFILFDRDFKEIKRFGNHPVRGMTTGANDFMQLQGEMVSYKNSFYFASRFFGYLCRYDISDEEDVTLKWEKCLLSLFAMSMKQILQERRITWMDFMD